MVQQYLSTPIGDFSFLEEIPNSTPQTPVNQGVSPKRRQRHVAVRDSQARLSKVGKPGSKRFKRYINNSFLQDQQWDLEPQDFQLHSLSCSPFSLLFEENNGKKWAPFVDITEEEQNYLLSSLHKEEQEDEFGDFVILPREEEIEVITTSPIRPEVHFRRVDKKIRRFIQKNPTNQFVLSLDQEILKYIELAAPQPKTFSFDQAFHRMICHGICQFYCLHSHSRDHKGGRAVTVKKPSQGFPSPEVTLSIFLQSLHNSQ